MIGVSLSRWTLSFFAAALVALLIAEALMAVGFGYPNVPVDAPETLALVHIVTIGWLSLLMCGALLQFLPVLVAQPLYSNALALPALASLVVGLVSLVCGFMQLAGHAAGIHFPFFAAAAGLLGLGFVLVIWNLVRTMIAAPERPISALFVIIGLISALFTVGLGAVFALVLGGLAESPALVDLMVLGLPAHIIAGLAGWLTFTAIGVSYRLLAMFMLAPDLDGPTTRIVFWLGTAALILAIPGGIIAVLAGADLNIVLLAALALAVIALACYGHDAVSLFRRRKRPKIELNSRTAAFALASFAATILLGLGLLVAGKFQALAGSVLFLAAFGWLSGLGLSQLYKIIAFMTWLECYGPVLGKAPTPRVQDLVVERRAIKWFALYFLSVWVGTILLLFEYAPGFRIAALLMLVATSGIVAQLLKTRRLVDVVAPQGGERFPEGAHLPHLLVSHS